MLHIFDTPFTWDIEWLLRVNVDWRNAALDQLMPLISSTLLLWVAIAAGALTSAHAQEVVMIGHSAPLTGPQAANGKDNENGVRLSRFVEGVTKDMPRSMMYKAFRNKRIKVNGKRAEPDTRLSAGDLIELYINDEFFPVGKPTARTAKPPRRQPPPSRWPSSTPPAWARSPAPTASRCRSTRRSTRR